MIEYTAQESPALSSPIAAVILRWWEKRGEMVLRVATALMAIAGGVWLGYEFWRLLFQSGYWGAIDLRILRALIQQWVIDSPAFRFDPFTSYPPASRPMLFPFLGWLPLTSVRWLWACTTVAALGWLTWLLLWQSRAETKLERAFVALIPFSMYATGATIGNGQLIVHLLPALLVSILMLQRDSANWRSDLVFSLLFMFALVKPSVSVPFFWILFFVPKGLRPAIFVVLGYLALTVFAVSFRPLWSQGMIKDLLTAGISIGRPEWGEANIHAILSTLGLSTYAMMMASLITLAVLVFWVYRNRLADLWLLLGVTALVARLWVYHAWYDDLLILLPMIALFRIAKRGGPDEWRVVGGVLLAMLVPMMIAPGGLYLLPMPWNGVYQVAQAVLWIAALMFLIAYAWRQKDRSSLAVA